METAGDRKVFSVSELAKDIKRLVESTFGSIWIEGEVSNLRQPPSGHLYLTLKDKDAVLGAAIFGGYRRVRSASHLIEGQRVLVHGRLTTYERSGQYQIIINRVEPLGLGALKEKFEKLKKKLQAEGLFDDQRKKSLPRLPMTVGLVTSPTGAAVRDMIDVLQRRFPGVRIILAPALVQGVAAAGQIKEAIERQNLLGQAEVLLVGRGGGSIEDLWAFNEEAVVRAIAASSIPVISAVGHEIDYTLADYVADLRAPTPSVAAELAVPSSADLVAELHSCLARMKTSLRRCAENARSRLEQLKSAPVLARPLEELVGGRRQRLDELQYRLAAGVNSGLSQLREGVALLGGRLQGLNPLAVLGRGYSVTFNQFGQLLSDAAQVKPGQSIITKFEKSEIVSRVEENCDGQK